MSRARSRRVLREVGTGGMELSEIWDLYVLAYDDKNLAAFACEERAYEMVKEACDGNTGPIETALPWTSNEDEGGDGWV